VRAFFFLISEFELLQVSKVTFEPLAREGIIATPVLGLPYSRSFSKQAPGERRRDILVRTQFSTGTQTCRDN